jgi:hypothetical protein
LVENAAKLCVFDHFSSPDWPEKRKKDGIYANICENIWIIQIFIVSLHRSFLVVPEAIQTIRCFFAHKRTEQFYFFYLLLIISVVSTLPNDILPADKHVLSGLLHTVVRIK